MSLFSGARFGDRCYPSRSKGSRLRWMGPSLEGWSPNKKYTYTALATAQRPLSNPHLRRKEVLSVAKNPDVVVEVARRRFSAARNQGSHKDPGIYPYRRCSYTLIRMHIQILYIQGIARQAEPSLGLLV